MRWYFLSISLVTLAIAGSLTAAEHAREGSLSELRAADAKIVEGLTNQGLRVLSAAPK